jgi:hypothetical protein
LERTLLQRVQLPNITLALQILARMDWHPVVLWTDTLDLCTRYQNLLTACSNAADSSSALEILDELQKTRALFAPNLRWFGSLVVHWGEAKPIDFRASKNINRNYIELLTINQLLSISWVVSSNFWQPTPGPACARASPSCWVFVSQLVCSDAGTDLNQQDPTCRTNSMPLWSLLFMYIYVIVASPIADDSLFFVVCHVRRLYIKLYLWFFPQLSQSISPWN